MTVRVGMEVQVRGRQGTWLIVGCDGSRVDVVRLDRDQAIVRGVLASRVREDWTPTERLARAMR